MCGIIGYTGRRPVASILLEGLKSLEYRGYDSAGIAVLTPQGQFSINKTPGKLGSLVASLEGGLPDGTVGIGHTRWATHGGPTADNAHPHTDCRGEVVVVHNGIVENYLGLKENLIQEGHLFSSQTDTEVIPHLIESYLAQEYPMEEALAKTALQLQGAHAVVAMSTVEPGKIMAFRLGSAGGIDVGYGGEEMLVASDLPALLPHTRRVAYLAGGEMVVLDSEQAQYFRLDGSPIEKEPHTVPYDPFSAVKGNYKHFMLKEISEQAETVMSTLRGRVSFDPPGIELEDFPFSDEEIRGISKVVLVGMGTSFNAAMVGRIWIESLAQIPAEADNSSEFRYRDPVVDDRTLVVSVGQSGETADTLAAMEEAARKGTRQITICNIEGSQATRLAQGVVYIRAGMEVGVAGSKTFTTSLTALYMLAAYLGMKRGTITQERLAQIVQELAHLPQMLGTILADQSVYEAIAQQFFKYSNFLYLGRGINYPIAMEGALKLKEISYIHAEGYPAGEMKHGPIALIDDNMPVVALALKDHLYGKMLNNISEAKTRGGVVIAVATEGDKDIVSKADHVIYVPQASPLINPILAAVPMQLLAYYVAVKRGCDVDQPRNLAKSVTVE